jgi:hypothetical protein
MKKISSILIDSANKKECLLWEKVICAQNEGKSIGGLTARPGLEEKRLKEGKRNRDTLFVSLPIQF